MTKPPHHRIRADVKAIAALLKQLDSVLAGPRAELVPRLRSLAFEVDLLVPHYDGHLIRVTFYSLAIGMRMKLPQEDMLTLEIAALLHDFGKLGVEQSMLDKEERLSDEEHTEVRHHAERGFHILSGFSRLERVAFIIRDHHERFDGSGYPGHKRGLDISLLSRIIAVADAYDAMTTTRPYRKRLTHQQAITELVRNAGGQFDPTVVKQFLRSTEARRGRGLRRAS